MSWEILRSIGFFDSGFDRDTSNYSNLFFMLYSRDKNCF